MTDPKINITRKMFGEQPQKCALYREPTVVKWQVCCQDLFSIFLAFITSSSEFGMMENY